VHSSVDGLEHKGTEMSGLMKDYSLYPARSPADWSAYHAIRREAIFTALLPG